MFQDAELCPSPPWFHYPERRLLAGFLGLLWSVLAGGCATTTAPVAPDTIAEVLAAPEPEASEYIPVVRYARYTLVELAPMAAQRDLLLQTIDVSMPEDARATVGDGLRHVLKRSGYGLCQTAHAVIELYALPLPAVHLHLGPMTLRDALLTLAGPAGNCTRMTAHGKSASSGPAIARSPSPHPSHPPPRCADVPAGTHGFGRPAMNAPQPAQRSTAAVVVQSLMWLWLIFLSVLAALGYQALSDQAGQGGWIPACNAWKRRQLAGRDDRGHPAAPGRRDGR